MNVSSCLTGDKIKRLKMATQQSKCNENYKVEGIGKKQEEDSKDVRRMGGRPLGKPAYLKDYGRD